MKKCPNCNTDLIDEARFCTVCGTSAPPPQQTMYAPEQPQQQQYMPPPPQGYAPMPPIYPGSDIPPNVESHLAKAILTTLFCCMPLGVVSIVFAAQVGSKIAVDDYDGALEYSNKANTWANWSIISSLVGVVLYVACSFIVGMSGGL